mmetsp:Transcript_7556/g.16334  ORF Transcript_7556/g.16334 Transcript_7556/m.16334 type:complete len:92 (+) Transcript_7556:426-701(+)
MILSIATRITNNSLHCHKNYIVLKSSLDLHCKVKQHSRLYYECCGNYSLAQLCPCSKWDKASCHKVCLQRREGLSKRDVQAGPSNIFIGQQ